MINRMRTDLGTNCIIPSYHFNRYDRREYCLSAVGNSPTLLMTIGDTV